MITQVLQSVAPWGWSDHLIIRPANGREIQVSWDMIQAIKNETLGEDVLAVELYPAESLAVRDENWRHLWTVPRDVLPIGFKRK